MKQSPIEPPKKKLKQARLPFQTLSPRAVKNPLETPTHERKRKASDGNSDNDVVICENTEVKENKLKQLEKKAKVDSFVLGNQTVDLTSKNDASQDGKEAMEVEEDKCIDKARKVATKTTNAEKQKQTVTPQFCNKTSVTSKKEKRISTFKVKLEFNPYAKTDDKNNSSKAETINFVDLTDSPVKDNSKNNTLTLSNCAPDVEDVSGVKEKTEELQKGNKYHVTENELQNPESKELKTTEKENKKNTIKKEELTKPDAKDNNESFCSCSDIKSKPTKCLKCKGSKLKLNSECKETNSLGSCDASEGQEDVCSKKDNISKEDKKHKIKTKPKKKLAIPSSNSERNTLSKFMTSTVGKNCDKEQTEGNITNIVDESEEKDLGCTISSTSKENSPEKSCLSSADSSLFKTPTTDNNSLEDSSESVNNATVLTPNTPTPSKKSISRTPSRMTPKQLMKLQEKEKQRKEKEQFKLEKERKKEEDKQEKIKLKQEREEEKMKMKQEKEEEKNREKKEKERKKQAEIDQKNEEKRQKEEEKRIKEEDKKSKAEEKRKKEEEERKRKKEKQLKDEQKESEKRKSAQAFASFFVKSETKGSPMEDDKENEPIESNFQSFEVKADMRLAPLSRVNLTDNRRYHLDQAIEVANTADTLYLQQLHGGAYTRGASEKTWPPPDETDDDIMIIESEKPNDEMEKNCVEVEKKSEKKRHRAKLLQFHENRRPPYWGTWRKKSKSIRPRAPLNQDKTMFEYDIDSDDEWEEPEDGESLRGSEDEESQDEQYEEDNDMFVPHGYLSEEEGQDEVDDTSPEAMKAKLKFLQMEFEAEMSHKQEKLKPRVIGCAWLCNSESDPKTVGSYITEMFLSRRAVWEGSLPLAIVAPLSSSPSTPADSAEQSTNDTRLGPKRKLVPDSMIPEVIKKVHGSRKKLSRLLNEILEDQLDSSLRPSKRCLADKIRELARWERNAEIGHHCWYVKEEVRQTHNLMDLKGVTASTPTLPSVTSFSSSITKFTKVLTSDERLKLLRDAPSSNSTIKKSPCVNPAFNLSLDLTEQPTPMEIGTSIKEIFVGRPIPAAKKRTQPLFPSRQSIPKQTSPSMMNFVQSLAKQTSFEQDTQISSTKELVKTEKKTKKRITPITLTTVVAKSPLPTTPPPSLLEECIVLSD